MVAAAIPVEATVAAVAEADTRVAVVTEVDTQVVEVAAEAAVDIADKKSKVVSSTTLFYCVCARAH